MCILMITSGAWFLTGSLFVLGAAIAAMAIYRSAAKPPRAKGGTCQICREPVSSDGRGNARTHKQRPMDALACPGSGQPIKELQLWSERAA